MFDGGRHSIDSCLLRCVRRRVQMRRARLATFVQAVIAAGMHTPVSDAGDTCTRGAWLGHRRDAANARIRNAPRYGMPSVAVLAPARMSIMIPI
ncbi:hypothetical protein [Xanthomonas arboricola]|uniref:hypothetical protein n=1 Tax=Xanthomonas arboricola TaxID=56448 RepID=UPI000F8E4AFF|nr:hypothetical protein [Xanthomonas arboricola]NIJ85819.1 hypothetical protein [Xanthomonas arboricola]